LRIESELESLYPGLRVLNLALEVKIAPSDPKLEKFKFEVEQGIRQKIKSLDDVKDQKIFRAYRDFFWKVGIDPTKTRPAGEALVRRILSGKSLPSINTLVDSYNLASAETSIAIAAFDIAKISVSDFLMRRAKSGEQFFGIGMEKPMALRRAEVVIEDMKNKDLVAIYPYRDAQNSMVSLETKSVLLMMCGVPGIETTELETAMKLSKDYVGRFCAV
jgi:DNA/RNA-binding domain of Phe-tRNA-synthetase-like protein